MPDYLRHPLDGCALLPAASDARLVLVRAALQNLLLLFAT
jgi:hypothetical protein